MWLFMRHESLTRQRRTATLVRNLVAEKIQCTSASPRYGDPIFAGMNQAGSSAKRESAEAT